jgi:succinate dehydrogenase / fumarate reductase membrane anchor subunit
MFKNEEKKELLLARHGISGLLLLPLLIWFLVSFISIMKDPFEYLPVFFYSPINAVFGIFFVIVALYHLNFDIKYTILNTVKCANLKNIFMLLTDFISLVTTVSVILSILQLHFRGIIIA